MNTEEPQIINLPVACSQTQVAGPGPESLAGVRVVPSASGATAAAGRDSLFAHIYEKIE
jgi:hypothetical protein